MPFGDGLHRVLEKTVLRRIATRIVNFDPIQPCNFSAMLRDLVFDFRRDMHNLVGPTELHHAATPRLRSVENHPARFKKGLPLSLEHLPPNAVGGVAFRIVGE